MLERAPRLTVSRGTTRRRKILTQRCCARAVLSTLATQASKIKKCARAISSPVALVTLAREFTRCCRAWTPLVRVEGREVQGENADTMF